MTDLERARSAEAARCNNVFKPLEAQLEMRLARIDVEMERRGLEHSDARLQALAEARLETLNQAVAQRIAIRKEMVRVYPDLGSPAELNSLLEPIREDIRRLRSECRKHGLIVAPEIFAELQDRAQQSIDTLKRETAAYLRARPKPISASAVAAPRVSAGNGAARSAAAGVAHPVHTVTAGAPVGLGAAYQKVEEVITDVESRNRKLAAALRCLAEAIKDSDRLADERRIYLEQVQFLAEQAARAAALRRIGVVKGLLVSLRAGLDGVTSVSPMLRAAGPMLSSHFGIKWPPA